MGQRPTAQDEKDFLQWPRTAPSPPPSAKPAPPSPSRPPPSSAPTRASRKTSPRPSASSSPNTTPSAPSTRPQSSAWPRPSKAPSTTRRPPCTSSASSGPSSPPQSGPVASTPKRSLRPATPPPAPPMAATTNMGLPSASKARRSAPASSQPTWRCRPTPSSPRPTAPSTPTRTSPAKNGKPTRPPPTPRSRRRPPSPRWEPSGADALKRRGSERPPPPFPPGASRRPTQPAVVCRPSSSHSARSIRPVRRQIREPTRFNGFSIRRPHHHRLNPTAVDRLQHGLTGRALPRTPPSHPRAAANENRHGRGGDPCGQSPRLTPIALRLLQDQPLLAFRQKRARHLLGNSRDRFLDRLLRPNARKTSSLRRLVRHRQGVRTGLDHPFDLTPLGFAFSTRRLQQRLKIAERRKIGLTRLLNRLQKRTHEPTFQRVDVHTPVERRSLDARDLLRKTEVTTPDGRRSHVDRRSPRSAGPLHSAHGTQPPVPVAWARISGNQPTGISLNTRGNSSVHHLRTR